MKALFCLVFSLYKLLSPTFSSPFCTFELIISPANHRPSCIIYFVYESQRLLPWKLEVCRRWWLEMTKHTENKKSGLRQENLWTNWGQFVSKKCSRKQEWFGRTRNFRFWKDIRTVTTKMADQPTSANPLPHSRGGRHRSRKQQKPSTAEREQKKASRLQALGPGESIKEKQVSCHYKRAKTFMTSWVRSVSR